MIHVGKPAPAFTNATAYQKGGEFTKISLEQYRGKWVVLFFYPRDFTFICPTEIKGFAKHADDFAKLNTVIIGASTDSEWSHKAWMERDLPEVAYPIIADTTHAISRDYDVLNDEGASERGLFVIDGTSVVRYAMVSGGSVGRSVKETLRVVEALQSGELCPMEWEPGQQTLGKA